jgi:cytochrome b pre-mRNA-processing protein 3
MLDYLFRRLTTNPKRGAALFEGVVALARKPHWYAAGQVPDTIDGRFCVLATVTALVLVRLEAEGEAGDSASVALTERFIEAMEAEHRELGLGDPTLGKTVRKLVRSLARRTELWRSEANDAMEWSAAARDSLYRDEPDGRALGHAARATQQLRAALQRLDIERMQRGELA